MNWSVGVITIPSRKATYLPHTLSSLERGGFPKPRLFVDGGHPDAFNSQHEVTARDPNLGAFGNFALGLWELVIRNPTCERFAMFQDDVACCTNLRPYLDKCVYPKNGWWNLFTYAASEQVIQGKSGWVEGGLLKSEDESCTLQKGQGALGLVFNRETALTLLAFPTFIQKPITTDPHQRVDGAVVAALNAQGYREFVHGPSLVQHTGVESSIKPGKKWTTYANTFRGEEWDPLKAMLLQMK